MAHDLRTTLSPIYPELLQGLLELLPRSISAPALTALLETFSSLFRYLLIPSVHFALLETTWHKICQILPRCLSEVQRAMAEVWGSVLRRMKSASRERAVTLLAQHTHQMEDASAWVVVFSCKVCFMLTESAPRSLTDIYTSLFPKPYILAHHQYSRRY